MTPATTDVPSGIDEVAPEWLTVAMGGPTVDGVRAERIAQDSGFSSLLYRLYLSGGAGLPATMIVKLPAESEARGAMEMMGGYAEEVSFYQCAADRAPIGTPHCHAARMAADSSDFVLVGWDAMPERSRRLCLTLVDRAVATIDEIDALEVFNE